MTSIRERKALGLVLLLPLGLFVEGCRGRADFILGEDAYRQGEYRQAYLYYWEAYGQRPCDGYLAALRLAGGRVAEVEAARGAAAEQRGDLDEAIERYALAVDYDPLSAARTESFARAWERREAAGELDREVAALRDRPREGDPWRESVVLRDFAASEPFPGRREAELRESLSRAAESIAAPLRAATFLAPLPETKSEIDGLHGRWARYASEMELLVADEEDGFFSTDLGRKEVAALGVFKTVLDPYREAAERGLSILELARRAVGHFEEASAFEAAGDYSRAADAFLLASVEHPFLEAARAGRARVLRRFGQEAYQAALLAVRERDWRAAQKHLAGLLRLLPEHVEARELLALARRELAQRYALEARRFEDAGLVANALVRYYLASEQTDGGHCLPEAVRRLEEAVSSRFRPRLRVSSRAVDPDERQARRDLWGVGDDALSRFSRDVEAATRRGIDAFTDYRPGNGKAGLAPELELLVEDLDFTYPQGDASPGVETARYVESFQLVPNPDLAAAVKAAADARASLEQALLGAASAPPLKQPLAGDLVSLALAKLRHAESLVASISARVPVLAWGSITYPTVHVKLRVEAAARFHLDGESRWVSASFDAVDRIVKGDPGRNVAVDPEELLSRGEALRILGPRLGEAIAREAEARLLSRQERLYREAIERLEAHCFDVATENLVVFLYSRRGKDDPLVKDAARRLESLTGCDLLSIWRREERASDADSRGPARKPGAAKALDN